MAEPLVSIIIPFHNHKPYIKRVFENLAEQTYGNWEAVFVDNNSTDGSREEVLELREGFPGKIACVKESRQGIPFARNTGLANSKGEYLSFLDVDDLFHPEKLSRQVGILLGNPGIGMVYGLTRRIYLETGRELIQATGKVNEGVNRPPLLAFNWIRSFYHLPQTGSTLVRRGAVEGVGGFPESLSFGNDDVGFHIKLACHHDIWFDSHEAVIYHRHKESRGASLNKARGVKKRYLQAYAWIIKYVNGAKDIKDKAKLAHFSKRGLTANLFSLGSRPEALTLYRAYKRDNILGEKHWTFAFLIYYLIPGKAGTLALRLYFRLAYYLSPGAHPLEP